jgi:hypothetical protein
MAWFVKPGLSIRGFPYLRRQLAGKVFREQARSYSGFVA